MNTSVINLVLPQVGTEPPVLHLVLRTRNEQVQALTREILDIALDELTMIADFYRNWDTRDNLSAQLIDWSLDVLLTDGETEMLDEEYIQVLTRKIQKLTNEILVNPLDGAPLEDPIIVDQSLWERWMWGEFNQLNPRPNAIVSTHFFALDLIRWRNSLPIAELRPVINLRNTLFEPLQTHLPVNASPFFNRVFFQQCNDPVSNIYKLVAFCLTENNAVIKQNVDHLTQCVTEATNESRALWLESRQRIVNLMEVTRREAELHTQKISALLESIQNSHQQDVEILRTLISNQRRKIQETRNRLDATVQNTVLQEHQIRHLRQDLANAQEKIGKIKNKIKKSRKFKLF